MIVVAEILVDLRAGKMLTTDLQEGLFVASVNLGIILMLPLGAYLADHYGRLRTVILGESIVFTASLSQMACTSAMSLTAARICVGFGMALCILLKPLYISELAETKHRGKIMTLFSLAFTTGILIVALLGIAIPAKDRNWRLFLGMGAIPALMLLLAAQFYLVESPVWLEMSQRRRRSEGEEEEEDDEAETRVSLTTGTERRSRQKCGQIFGELFTQEDTAQSTWIAVLLGLLYEFDGIWMLILYRSDIFSQAVGEKDVHVYVFVMCLVLLLANIVPGLLIDRVGRRKLLWSGFAVSMLAKILVGTLFFFGVQGLSLGLILMVWAGAAQCGVSVVSTVVISEIFDSRHRSVGMCFVYWFMLTVGFGMSLIFKGSEVTMGYGGWMFVFTVASGLVVVPLYRGMPETMSNVI